MPFSSIDGRVFGLYYLGQWHFYGWKKNTNYCRLDYTFFSSGCAMFLGFCKLFIGFLSRIIPKLLLH
jgi:hypothetical protein